MASSGVSFIPLDVRLRKRLPLEEQWGHDTFLSQDNNQSVLSRFYPKMTAPPAFLCRVAHSEGAVRIRAGNLAAGGGTYQAVARHVRPRRQLRRRRLHPLRGDRAPRQGRNRRPRPRPRHPIASQGNNPVRPRPRHPIRAGQRTQAPYA